MTSALLLVPVRTVVTILVWDGERYALFAIRADELSARTIEWKIVDIDRNARTGASGTEQGSTTNVGQGRGGQRRREAVKREIGAWKGRHITT